MSFSSWLYTHLIMIGIVNFGDAIISGWKAREGQFPYIAYIQILIDNKIGECGGGILDETHIITAAHCVYNYNMEDMSVIVNKTLIMWEENDKWGVINVTVHPKYKLGRSNISDSTFCWHSLVPCVSPLGDIVADKNDIAVLTLENPLPLGEHLRKLEMINCPFLPYGDKCQFAGWGSTDSRSDILSELKWTELVILRPQQCASFDIYHRNEEFCAVDPERRSALFYGDSGSPLICENVLSGKDAELFSVALFNAYSPPAGFCFDILCQDEPLIDDPESPDYNIKSKIKVFYDYVMNQARHYQTNHIILTMGGDFTYQLAEQYFINLDRLIRYTHEIYGKEVNVFYSTPSCYIKSLNTAQKTWATKSDDFFPYSSDPHAFWTGYFTSRPTLKYFERLGNNFLQIVKQLAVLSNAMDSKDLEYFREAMGVMQHHDAVTGTEKQHVAEDYARLLHNAVVRGEKIVSDAVATLSMKKEAPGAVRQEFKTCLLLNISSCEPVENVQTFTVTLYNPRSHPVSTYVRIPVTGKGYIVKDYIGTEIVTQLLPIPVPVTQIPGRTSNASRELVFRALEIPPLGYQTFYITEKDEGDVIDDVSRPEAIPAIGGDLYEISVDDAGNVVIQWKNLNLRVVQSFQYYEGAKGNNSEFKYRASGAYIFRPNQSMIHPFTYSGSHQFYKGSLVEELHLILNNYVSQVVRIYNGEDRIEFDWLVGPIPVNDSRGKEIVTRFTSNLGSEGVFYTDSNGREMLKRIRDFRPTWNLNLSEPIAGNYYPVTAKISLKDEAKALRISVLNDRAQGGTSLADGDLEIMLHRRLLNDDAFGVGEALNEEAFGTGLVARGVHNLVGSSLKDLDAAALKEKSLALLLALKPWVLVTPVKDLTFDQWKEAYVMQTKTLRKRLPPNVHILTYEPWKNNEILLRLEHLFEIGEATQLSQPVEINLADLFVDFDIVQVRETTLGGNQWIEEKTRLQWNSESNEIHPTMENLSRELKIDDGAINVLLKAMEIRTFVITIVSPIAS